MTDKFVFEYSLYWKMRHLISFFLACIVLYSVTYFTVGVEYISNEPLSIPMICLVIGILIFINIRGEKRLAKRIEIYNNKVTVIQNDNISTTFEISDILKVSSNMAKKTVNVFGVKETVLKIKGQTEIVIPSNINNHGKFVELISQKI